MHITMLKPIERIGIWLKMVHQEEIKERIRIKQAGSRIIFDFLAVSASYVNYKLQVVILLKGNYTLVVVYPADIYRSKVAIVLKKKCG